MKKFYLLILLALVMPQAMLSQLVNCNPDPNGPIWIAGDVNSNYSPHEQTLIDNMDILILNSTHPLPQSGLIDNSSLIFFPAIMSQLDLGMCSQASLVAYVFTYEVNYKRNSNAMANLSNRFQPSFTYNFLNGGNGSNGSSLILGIEILKEAGCPDRQTYGDGTGGVYGNINEDCTQWMNGYNHYETALENRVISSGKIDLNNDLNILKYWLFNHNNDVETAGGIASVVFANMTGVSYDYIIDPDPFYNGNTYIVGVEITPDNDAHVMTIVGYDNNVICGSYRGALKLANSWGVNWQTSGGFVYLPYDLINTPGMLLLDNQSDNWAFVLNNIAIDDQPEFIMRQSVSCDDRYYIYHLAGAADIQGHETPDATYKYESYNDEIGHYPMLGENNSLPLNFSIDLSYFLDNYVPQPIDDQYVYSFFYGIKQRIQTNPTPGWLWDLQLVDNRCDQELIIQNNLLQFPIYIATDNVQYHWFGIDYSRLPENISSNLNITQSTICHCQSVITNGAKLTIAPGTQLKFYDGELIIEEGCTLELNGNCDIRAISGQNKIIVYGDLVINGTPTVVNELGSLTIIYETSISQVIGAGNFTGNTLAPITIQGINNSELEILNCNFTNCHMDFLGDLSINNVLMNNTKININGGDLEVSNCQSLTDTYISASHPNSDQSMISITANNFENLSSSASTSVIDLNDYYNFNISSNEIYYAACDGISVFHAGNLTNGEKIIYDNTIDNEGVNGTNRGISLFFSQANIINNIIKDNEFGLIAFGKSKANVLGNESAHSTEETQQFLENKVHCLFSYSSFPNEIHFNYFSKSGFLDNPYIQLVDYDIIDPTSYYDFSHTYDITCNCWDENFDPLLHLVPFTSFLYEPEWCPNLICSSHNDSSSVLYNQANYNVSINNLSQADSLFKILISNYPNEYNAISSLIELFSLEEANGKNFQDLRDYYLSIVYEEDSLLSRSANWLSMHCLIKLGDYQSAIDWLDSVLTVQDNTVDSTFALINLGYILTHIPDTSSRSSLVSTHTDLIPTSYEKYRIQREELVNELLKVHRIERIGAINNIYQNSSITRIIPNPLRYLFDVEWANATKGQASFEIISSLGQKVLINNLGIQSEGTLKNRIYTNNLQPGIYFLLLKINNQAVDIKKLIIL
jgi:hypothetical protein